ncbi:hypothetical protein [Shewanella sp. 4_MG-2023]|uniref:hypothetical protein n=1 Tax=Shewanella sp. 4_MG-2023 TaxID=3062652 RepID=UPI0026E1B7B0|nr:hypothetical protein [Shewanella sp. 4_MG-2023]MDO6677106.1 hypothetical protein [Shewanella sp. 4_MG-2023]
MFTRLAKKIKSKVSAWERLANSAKQGYTVRGLTTFSGASSDYETGQEYPFLAVIDKANIDSAIEHITELLSINDWSNVVIDEYSELLISEYSDKDVPEDWQQAISEQGAFYIIYVESDV